MAHPMLATPTLIKGDAVRMADVKNPETAPLYLIDEVDDRIVNGFNARFYRVRRDAEGARPSRKWYGRGELVIVGLTVEVNGKVVAGREQWR